MNRMYVNQKGSIGTLILDFIQSIVLALAVFVLIYMFVAQPNEVKGNSMLPNFETGEYLLTDKLSYLFSDPKRGDVVVFKAPATEPCAETECEYIKRVIGVPGDKIKVEKGHVYLNGNMMNESFLSPGTVSSSGAYNKEGVEMIIGKGQYLCFGDNRPHSRDGREFGTIEKNRIVGKAFFVYWPTKAFGLVKRINL